MVEKISEDENKELLLDGHRQNLANAEQEIADITKLRTEQTEILELLRKKAELKESMHQIAMNDFTRTEAPWSFQMNPEWIELQRQASDVDHQFEMRRALGEIKGFEERLANFDDQLQSLVDSRDKLQSMIAELEENDE